MEGGSKRRGTCIISGVKQERKGICKRGRRGRREGEEMEGMGEGTNKGGEM